MRLIGAAAIFVAGVTIGVLCGTYFNQATGLPGWLVSFPIGLVTGILAYGCWYGNGGQA